MINSEITQIFNKLNNTKIENWEAIRNNEEYKYLFFLFSILENPELKNIFINFRPIISIIFEEIAKNSIENGGYIYNLKKTDIIFLYTIFFIKSFLSSSFVERNDDFLYITSDSLILNFIELERKFWIFYYSKVNIDTKKIKIALIKTYGLLIYKNLIHEKKETSINLKSTVFLSIGVFSYKHAIDSKININTKPYSVKSIDNKIYLVGSSFLNISCVTRVNSYSNKCIKFKDLNYIEKLTKIKSFICYKDFKDIEKEYKIEYKIDLDKIDELLKSELCLLREKYQEKNKIYQEILNFYKELAVASIFKYLDNQWCYSDMNQILIFLYEKLIIEKISRDLNIQDDKKWSKIVLPFFLGSFTYDEYSKVEIKNLNNFMLFLKNKVILLNNEKNSIIARKALEEINKTKEKFKIINYCENKKKFKTISEVELKKNIREDVNLFIKLLKLFNFYDNKEIIKKEYSKKNLLEEELVFHQRKISIFFFLYNFKIIEEIGIFEKEIFFPFFFDFRGRKYDDSCLSVTNFTPSRYFLNYGVYEKSELEILNNYDIGVTEHENVINEIAIKFEITNKAIYIKNAIFWTLIAIGKEFLIKNKSSYTTNEIIEKACLILNNKEFIPEDLEKKIIIKHYYKILDSLKNSNPIKRFIHKDATASFIQNLIRIIGAKDESSLKLANLYSTDEWYDTYNIALEYWKKSLIIENEEIILKNKKINTNLLLFFTRKTIKKVVMTSSYDSTFFTRWKYFIEEVREKFERNEKKNEELLLLFTEFYNFIEYTFWDKVFLDKPSSILIDRINKQIFEKKEAVINAFDGNTDIIYYKTKINKIYVYIPILEKKIHLRRTKNIYSVDEENIHSKKIRQSVKANWTHFSDATLIRQINNKLDFPLLSIHDCFLVDQFRVSHFIQIANKCFSEIEEITIAEEKKINMIKKSYSVFIFI